MAAGVLDGRQQPRSRTPRFWARGWEYLETLVDTADFNTQAKAARILIVDDDPAIRRMLVSDLNEHDLRANAVDGRQGLLHAPADRESDLIVLDLRLGEDGGLDILREPRITSVVPVILDHRPWRRRNRSRLWG